MKSKLLKLDSKSLIRWILQKKKKDKKTKKGDKNNKEERNKKNNKLREKPKSLKNPNHSKKFL